MRIQILSDLHLEVDPSFRPEPAAGADVLVLAGDVGAHTRQSRLGAALEDEAGRLRLADGSLARFGLERFSPVQGWPTPVLYVPGNHEYDGQELLRTKAHLRAVCDELGITWLDDRTLYVDRVRRCFSEQAPTSGAEDWVRWVGSTLWADFDALGPRHNHPQALTQQLEARRKAFSAANWYLRTVGTTFRHADGTLQPLDAALLRELALDCMAHLHQTLAQPFAGQTVVVTHFAPSLRSADPRFGLTPGTAGFCNALDDWLAKADLWIHGHLHCPNNYLAGRCRVVANPLGYAKKHEQAGFVSTMLIDV